MTKGLLKGLCIAVLLFPGVKVWAQVLTEEDKAQISLESERTIIALEALLNYLADPSKAATRASLTKESYNPENTDRIFSDPEVRIEYDIDPRNETPPPGAPHQVKKYLNNLHIFYQPNSSTPSNSIRFSNIRIIEIDQKNYTYARVFFLSKFNGLYANDHSLQYKRTKRVAEIQAEEQEGRWKTRILNISFARTEEVEAVFGNEENVLLVTRLEEAIQQLNGDRLVVTQTIDNIVREIRKMEPEFQGPTQMNDQTYRLALKTIDLADSLALKALEEVQLINQSTAVGKLQASAMDSLLRVSDSEVENILSTVEHFSEELELIKAAQENSQQYLAETQIAAIIADTLVREVLADPNDVDAVVTSYDKASSIARDARGAANQSAKQEEIIGNSLDRMKNSNLAAKSSQERATSLQNRVERLLDETLREQQNAEKAKFKANLYLVQADSAIGRVEEMIAPAIYDPERQNMRVRGMTARIDDALYQLRFTAREATNLAGSLNDAAIATENQELIGLAKDVVRLGQEIVDQVDEAQPNFYAAMDRARLSNRKDTTISEAIRELSRQKLEVLNTLGRARRAKNRATYMAGGTDQVIDEVKIAIAEARREKQGAIESLGNAASLLNEAEAYLANAHFASQSADREAKEVDLAVNQAYRKVVKNTLKIRRHSSPYLGINYNFFQSSRRNLNESTFGSPFNNNELARWGLSLYYRVGGFVSGFSRYTDPMTEIHYTPAYIAEIEQRLTAADKEFSSLTHTGSGANGQTYSFGVYISPLQHIYLMAGLSGFSGYTWENYEGSYPQEDLPASYSGTNQYVMEYNQLSSNGFLLGAAFVWPYFQLEGGYNFFYNDVFLNVGFNVPLRKTYTFSRTRNIPREEYDQLMQEWKNSKLPENN